LKQKQVLQSTEKVVFSIASEKLYSKLLRPVKSTSDATVHLTNFVQALVYNYLLHHAVFDL